MKSSSHRIKWLCALLFLLYFGQIVAVSKTHLANAIIVTGFRTSTLQDRSRLVFDLSAKAEYVLFTLANPDRLVLDIKNARLGVKLNPQLHIAHVKDFRASHHDGYLRIVLDLNHPVTPKSFMFVTDKAEHFRLVIDLGPIAAMNSMMLKNSPPTVSPHVTVRPLLPPPNHLALHHPTPSFIAAAKPQVPVTPPVAVVSVPARVKPRNIIVVIDPGHGGKDPGTTGPGGTHEKDVVLTISKDLARLLNSEPGFHAELTRTGDYYIPLRGRLAIARKDKADMFIAIHADAYQYKDAMGASVYALSERGATSEAARWLAEKENRSELLGGTSLPNQDNILRSVLIDLSQTNTISESLQIGTSVLHQLSNVAVLHYDRVEQAAFVVLKSPDIPSILVETGFLSTPAQERQLVNPRYQEKLANAMMQGIKSYFIRNPPPDTFFAIERHRSDSDKYALMQNQ